VTVASLSIWYCVNVDFSVSPITLIYVSLAKNMISILLIVAHKRYKAGKKNFEKDPAGSVNLDLFRETCIPPLGPFSRPQAAVDESLPHTDPLGDGEVQPAWHQALVTKIDEIKRRESVRFMTSNALFLFKFNL
jgi:hypothetical protein